MLERVFSLVYRHPLFKFFLLAGFIWGCEKVKPHHEVKNFMRCDTVVTVTLVIKDKTQLEPIWNKVDSLLVTWEKRFSQTHPESEVWRLNNSGTDTVSISPVLSSMILNSQKYGDTLSAGFDFTILPIKELWGLGEKSTAQYNPSQMEIDSALQYVNYRNVYHDPKNLKAAITHPGTRVDVGGIAKSYVLVDLARLLDSLKFTDYLIVAGGDVVCKGHRHDGGAWQIAIQHPRNPEGYLGKLGMTRGSIVTSGDYERYWELNGKRVHHIFNSKTGYSCNANQSVTLYAETAIEADILSTGLYCLTADSLIAFVNQRPRLQALVVDSIGQIKISNGWKDKVTLF